MKKVKTFEIWSSSRPMEIDAEKELDNVEADDYVHMDKEMLMNIIDSFKEELNDCLNTNDLKEVTEKMVNFKNKYTQLLKNFRGIWTKEMLTLWHKKLKEIEKNDPERFKEWNDSYCSLIQNQTK